MSDARLSGTEAKAIELVCNGHVRPEITGARVFPVQSSDRTRTYTVVVAPDPADSRCSCPAGRSGRLCKHITAAGLQIMVDAQRDAEPVGDDACRRCGDYLDPARGRSVCDNCSTVRAVA